MRVLNRKATCRCRYADVWEKIVEKYDLKVRNRPRSFSSCLCKCLMGQTF